MSSERAVQFPLRKTPSFEQLPRAQDGLSPRVSLPQPQQQENIPPPPPPASPGPRPRVVQHKALIDQYIASRQYIRPSELREIKKAVECDRGIPLSEVVVGSRFECDFENWDKYKWVNGRWKDMFTKRNLKRSTRRLEEQVAVRRQEEEEELELAEYTRLLEAAATLVAMSYGGF